MGYQPKLSREISDPACMETMSCANGLTLGHDIYIWGLLRYNLLVLWSSSIFDNLHGKKIMTRIWAYLLPSLVLIMSRQNLIIRSYLPSMQVTRLSHYYFLSTRF
jgi:hypothetical protein